MPSDRKNDVHDLIPATVAVQIPLIGETRDEKDPIVFVKIFAPDDLKTWYVTEYDAQRRVCFGQIRTGFLSAPHRQLSKFTVDELEKYRGSANLRVVRYLDWDPKPLSKCL